MIEIEVEPRDEWRAASEEVQAFVAEVAMRFAPALAEAGCPPIVIRRDESGPQALYERTESGQQPILLATRWALWSQITLQFAHELCHVLSNMRPADTDAERQSQWIDESLCEVASLFALRAMARRWAVSEAAHRVQYAPAFEQYSAQRLAAPARQVPAGVPFAGWLAAALPSMKADRYLRDHNGIVARELLPIFEADPDAWRAIRYLNKATDREAPYFEAWRSAAPSGLHGTIDRVAHLLTPS